MARGDRIEVVVDAGDGQAKTYVIEATKNGRKVAVFNARGGIVEVIEATRNGEPVRTARFMASRVIAMVETPVEQAEEPEQVEIRPASGGLELPDPSEPEIRP